MVDIHPSYKPYFQYLYQQDLDLDEHYEYHYVPPNPHLQFSQYFTPPPSHSQFLDYLHIPSQEHLSLIKWCIPNFEYLCYQQHLNPNSLPILLLLTKNAYIFFVTIGDEYFNVFKDSQQLLYYSQLPYQHPFSHKPLFLWVIQTVDFNDLN